MGWSLPLFTVVFLLLTASFFLLPASSFSILSIPLPYHYSIASLGPQAQVAGADLPSLLNSYAFVFVCTLLLFGLGGAIAGATEAVKVLHYASLGATPFEYAFLFPQFLAVFAAGMINSSLIEDWRGQASFSPMVLLQPLGFLAAGLVVLLALYFSRPFFA